MTFPQALALRAPRRLRLLSALILTLASATLWAADPAPNAVALPRAAPARATGFDAGFLQLGNPDDQSRVDISAFAERNVVQAGLYRAEIWVNGTRVGFADLQFVAAADASADATPCLSPAMLQEWGIDVHSAAFVAAGPQRCVDLPALVPQASVSFDMLQQRLDIGVPQVAMWRPPRGAVTAAQWDAGETAQLLDYSMNVTTGSANHVRNDAAYGAVRAGLNVGPWRLRSTLNVQSGSNQNTTVQAVDNYLQRDVAPLQGRLTLGQAATSSDIFDGIAFTGVQLASDDSMLPDDQQGYAPVVRGVAQTNARVTIRQRGFDLYSGLVAPGPFAIDNLPNATTGDLEVIITEADGRETRFIAPFASLPVMVREGGTRYSATLGKYRDAGGGSGPTFGQATLTRGLLFDFTLFGGLLGAHIYQAGVLGVGKNLGEFGAVSADVSASHTRRDPQWGRYVPPLQAGDTLSGQSYRVLYGKVFANGLNLRVAGMRYSTAGYRTFGEAVAEQNAAQMAERLDYLRVTGARKSQVQGSLSQPLGRYGSIYASISQQIYYSGPRNLSAQVGYSATLGPYALGVYYSQGRSAGNETTRQISANLSIPFGPGPRNAMVTASVTHDSVTGMAEQLGVNGTALADRSLAYALNAQYGSRSGHGDGNVSYSGRYATLGGNVSAGEGYHQTGVSLSGSMALHQGGITLGQSLGDTAALIDTHGAPDVAVSSLPGVRTDEHGYAIVPNLSAYRANRIELDPAARNRDDTVEMQDTVKTVVPTRGALAKVSFDSRIGSKALLTLTDAAGLPLPFGAQVVDARGRDAGVVGEHGETYVTGLAASGELAVRWGARGSHQCVARYQLDSSAAMVAQLQTAAARCVPVAAP
ncbi:fimbria/pilus outer membrane usher protein [Amantichitinum ursilacus]|uniref:Outer membrane usher protein FimD n=1 Tax=Amantichitinum ursilacus TaxID=857265 RepID=A0A0N0XG84_9NEIS|nr:fimbria/pilus outer membrane usher protein [Amantichitinum ursilacus]KPC49787.1 Outer membrane usher protein FimD precursor [Amantichitinum ursilacus]